MKSKLLALITAGTFWGSMCVAQAASVEVEWKSPEEFTDIRPANESRKGFRKRVFKRLEKFLTEYAESLPEDQILKITFTDLDLAGQVWPANFTGLVANNVNDVRIIRRVDIPRMEFAYQLVDANQAVLQKGEVKLKDLGFQERFNPAFRSEELRYEKNMLRLWFRDEFPHLMAKSN